ncbi:unnamed protein product [Cuscuta campestris]|uniref:Reverse transcriptase domain-containing protein n=1 Tax=Cuscuta campestris TaxID=132261 RepID=A0A484MY16_9ASTE|nr:unnamed protein product [Cuscuta campestris]
MTPKQTCPQPNGLRRNLRSKFRWFTGFCNSHQNCSPALCCPLVAKSVVRITPSISPFHFRILIAGVWKPGPVCCHHAMRPLNNNLNRLFSEVVSSGFKGKQLEGKPTGLFKGIPSVSFTNKDIKDLSSRFKHALVAKFQSRPSFTTMRNFMQQLGLQGKFNISTLSHQRFLLNLELEEDYLRLFMRRSWRVHGYNMTLTKWSPSLSQESESPIMPIWISIPNLPIHLHDKRALLIIASTIGHPLKVDSCTLNFSRPQLARCCVEVDISSLRHLHENILHSPILEEVEEPTMYSLAIVPYEGATLLVDDVPEVGFFNNPMDIEETILALDDFPPLPKKGNTGVPNSPKASKSSGKAVIEHEQTISCSFSTPGESSSIWISSIYGKHCRKDRESLWTSLRDLFPRNDPWILGGDFNTVASITEHKGEVCPNIGGIEDFVQTIHDCELFSPPFLGSQFTWFGKRGRGRVYRRLDRILTNELFMDHFQLTEIKHLGRGNSDHRPLLLKAFPNQHTGPKPFKFINAWCSHSSFNDLLKSNWPESYTGGGMRGLALKLSNLKKALITWNKETFGNIFEAVSKAEDRANKAEEILEQNDRAGGSIHTHQDDIAKEAVEHFTKVFSTNYEGDMDGIFRHLISSVSEAENVAIGAIPEEEEIKKIIWSLNANSTAGTDGFNGYFFRYSWEIIKVDVCKAVLEYFLGIPMPKAFGSTLITLIPKTDGAITLDHFRPISLSTFFSKITSRLLSDKLKMIIPNLISLEQAAFQQGKGITEHVLMVKEMVQQLSAKVRGGNCIIKLDLSKAFDKLSWKFLRELLLKLGFSPIVIKLLMGNLESTFFSVLINGQPKGFFPMKCGVKQGDPLSPLLFILAMEGLTRMLQHCTSNGLLIPFSSGRVHPPSHLLYADDIVIFTNVDSRNLLKLGSALSTFMKASGQEINFAKSQVIVHEKMNPSTKRCIKRILGIHCNSKEFTYLGSTIVKGKLRKIHCKDLIGKFERRINTWYSKKLNQMGRLILIKHVLSSIPLHILAAQTIPKSILKSLNRLMANYFWGVKDHGYKYHWRKWERKCLPLEEGGLGLRNFTHCQQAASIDLWWKITHGQSIWSKYMKMKYLRDGQYRPHLYDSYTWKAICKIVPRTLPFCTITQDEITWNEGPYSFQKAYLSTIDHMPKQTSCSYIWDKRQMGKISLFLWRGLNRLLPFPCHLQKLKIFIPELCPFCNEVNVDEHHILINCNRVAEVWKSYAYAAGAPSFTCDLTLHQALLSWWFSSNKSTIKGNIHMILPGLITWSVWKSYNSIRFEAGSFSRDRLMTSINLLLQTWFWAHKMDTTFLYNYNVFRFGIHTFKNTRVNY